MKKYDKQRKPLLEKLSELKKKRKATGLYDSDTRLELNNTLAKILKKELGLIELPNVDCLGAPVEQIVITPQYKGQETFGCGVEIQTDFYGHRTRISKENSPEPIGTLLNVRVSSNIRNKENPIHQEQLKIASVIISNEITEFEKKLIAVSEDLKAKDLKYREVEKEIREVIRDIETINQEQEQEWRKENLTFKEAFNKIIADIKSQNLATRRNNKEDYNVLVDKALAEGKDGIVNIIGDLELSFRSSNSTVKIIAFGKDENGYTYGDKKIGKKIKTIINKYLPDVEMKATTNGQFFIRKDDRNIIYTERENLRKQIEEA